MRERKDWPSLAALLLVATADSVCNWLPNYGFSGFRRFPILLLPLRRAQECEHFFARHSRLHARDLDTRRVSQISASSLQHKRQCRARQRKGPRNADPTNSLQMARHPAPPRLRSRAHMAAKSLPLMQLRRQSTEQNCNPELLWPIICSVSVFSLPRV
jgi:hypothetical protein